MFWPGDRCGGKCAGWCWRCHHQRGDDKDAGRLVHRTRDRDGDGHLHQFMARWNCAGSADLAEPRGNGRARTRMGCRHVFYRRRPCVVPSHLSAPESAVVSAVRIKVQKLPVLALFLAAVIWGLYNAALAMVFSFGPALLNQQGWYLTSAGSMTSVFMIVFSVFLPLGGILEDRKGRRDKVIMKRFLGYDLFKTMALYELTAVVPIIFVVVGLLFSLCAGPMMILPSLILPPSIVPSGWVYSGTFITADDGNTNSCWRIGRTGRQ